MFIAALFTIGKTGNQPKCPSMTDRENVAHIHHGILCTIKNDKCVLCRDMDEPGKHHSQQTDTGTENQTLSVLTRWQMLNNENTWTQGGEHHIVGSVGGQALEEGQH